MITPGTVGATLGFALAIHGFLRMAFSRVGTPREKKTRMILETAAGLVVMGTSITFG